MDLEKYYDNLKDLDYAVLIGYLISDFRGINNVKEVLEEFSSKLRDITGSEYDKATSFTFSSDDITTKKLVFKQNESRGVLNLDFIDGSLANVRAQLILPGGNSGKISKFYKKAFSDKYGKQLKGKSQGVSIKFWRDESSRLLITLNEAKHPVHFVSVGIQGEEY